MIHTSPTHVCIEFAFFRLYFTYECFNFVLVFFRTTNATAVNINDFTRGGRPDTSGHARQGFSSIPAL